MVRRIRRVGQSKAKRLRSRRNDDIENEPRKRADDLYVKLSERVPLVGGSEFAASGHTVIGLVGYGLVITLIVLSHIFVVEAIHEFTYVITLTEPERKALNLQVPKRLLSVPGRKDELK